MKFNLAGTSAMCVKVISAHGATDVLSPHKLWPYALVGLPCNAHTSPFISLAFGASSVAHFAQDIGFKAASLMLVVLFVASMKQYRLAARTIVAFMMLVHVPLHYVSQFIKHGILSVGVGMLFTLFIPSDTNVTERRQLVVIAHVVSNALPG